MPDTMDEHVMTLNEKLQALAAFEDAADIGATAQHLGDHEEGHSLQMKFVKFVLSVISVLRPRNPFLPHNVPDLVTLHTREVMPSATAQTLCNAYNRGKDLHDAFVSGLLMLPSHTPSRGQLSRRSQDIQMIQRTEAKSLH